MSLFAHSNSGLASFPQTMHLLTIHLLIAACYADSSLMLFHLFLLRRALLGKLHGLPAAQQLTDAAFAAFGAYDLDSAALALVRIPCLGYLNHLLIQYSSHSIMK